ncbi:MAG: hypothetical protein JSU68_06155 [Phycisphaerales bacterium]|nr:MAG: hypothetical protein JSU68_06155 [Phycisphaerales bacterium]
MIAAGWVMMIISLGFVLGLVAFCFWRVLSTPPEDEAGAGDGDISLANQDR